MSEKRPRSEDGGEITKLHLKKRRRKLLLGEDLDAKVQIYLKMFREGGHFGAGINNY